jgi:hydroxyethylthiazole kinase-like uncharacterized protein yjeF
MLLTVEAHACAVGVALPEAAVQGMETTESGELGALTEAARDLVSAATSVLVGPGIATAASPASVQIARIAARVVIDAGSLHADAVEAGRGRAILTPHAGEMATLMGLTPGEVNRHAEALAQVAADRFDTVVVLKGPTTWIAVPGGERWMHRVDAPGLGTSGSGDVLAGLILGLLARGAGTAQAAVWGVALHGHAGRLLTRRVGTMGFLARELSPCVPRLLDRLA